MQALSPAMICNVWEQGAGLHPLERALLILDYGCPEHGREAILDLSLGARDRLLFDIYRRTFGEALEAYTECPACHERLEFSLSCAAFVNDDAARQVSTQCVEINGIEFSLRPPNSRDAAAAAGSESLAAAKQTLLTRCATPVARIDHGVDALPESMQREIATAIADLDPQAELLMDLVCPTCGGAWQGVFEIISFLWAEIRARARRLLQEIDVLARTYGWREADILALSDARRSLYVQMAMT